MAYQTINNGEQFITIRTKINSNFTLAESTENRITAITSTPSDTKYPSEKAVANYASKIYQSASIPTTRSGDLLLKTTGTNTGKIMYNASGTLGEFVPDRAICNYKTASELANVVLLKGELAVESDTKQQKIGDGTTLFSALPYLIGTSGGGSSSGFTTGGANEQGWMKTDSGLIIQWGNVATSLMAPDPNMGGYKKWIVFQRPFVSAPVVTTTPDYSGGFPKASSGGNSATGVFIQCDVQLDFCNVSWIAMGF